MQHIDKILLDRISLDASQCERKRKNYNFHKEDNDLLQRMLNALQPGTYVRPHKHENPDKREAFIILRGKILIVEFDHSGKVADYIIAGSDTGNYGAEVGPGIWHMIVCLEKNTVYYEVKDGPYNPQEDKIFADWSPPESDPSKHDYLNEIMDHCLRKNRS